jgi:geranylgeranyl pyrophosphate synthase
MEPLSRCTTLVGEKLLEFFKDCKTEFDYHPFMVELHSALKEYCLRRGKRIAACTTLFAYQGYAGRTDDKILTASVGVELYRHAILIHDDMVDEDRERRGGKAFHCLFKGEERFGSGTALFAGNLLYALALEALGRGGFEKEKVERVRGLFIDEYRRVNESQCLDLFFEYQEPSLEEWQVMASRRAASLFKATVLGGAVFAGAPRDELPLLEKAAENMGYSFDITDDIIGTFAAEDEYGRSPGGDIRLGKKPLHIIYALELLGGGEREEFTRLLKKKESTAGGIERIKELIKKSGALEKAKAESKRYAEAGKKAIAKTSMSPKAKENFSTLIDYVSENLDWYR